MKNILFLLMSSLIFSCSSQKDITEFIQLSHNNVMVITGDKLVLTLIPTSKKRKKPVIVKIVRNGEYYDNKRISMKDYEKIREIILTIKPKDLEIPKDRNYFIGRIDGGVNSIYLKKDTVERKYYIHGISEQYHGKFYNAAKLILKSAKMDISHIDW